MAYRIVNRVKMTTDTIGDGPSFNLTGASTKFRSVSDAGLVNGDIVSYVAESGNDWENGRGTVSGLPSTPALSRDEVYASSASGAKIPMAGGTVAIGTVLAEDFHKPEYGISLFNESGAAIARGGYPVTRHLPSARTFREIHAEVTHGQSGDTVQLRIYKNGALEYGPTDVVYGTPLDATDAIAAIAGDEITFDLDPTVGTPWGFWAQVV